MIRQGQATRRCVFDIECTVVRRPATRSGWGSAEQGSNPFTAVTRVRISYGTPSVFKDLDRFNGTHTGVMRQIYGMDATERHGMEAAPKRRIIARSAAVSRYELYANLSADRPGGDGGDGGIFKRACGNCRWGEVTMDHPGGRRPSHAQQISSGMAIRLLPTYLGTGGSAVAASELPRARYGFAFRAVGHSWRWPLCPVQSLVRTTAPTVSS
jgi:hypothetical protein